MEGRDEGLSGSQGVFGDIFSVVIMENLVYLTYNKVVNPQVKFVL